MANKKTEAQQQAYDLYVNTELTQKDICKIVSVSPTQMSKWATTGNWEMYKKASKVTTQQLILDHYSQIAAINKEIKDKQNGMPTPAQTDMMTKLSGHIERLQKKFNLSVYHSVLRECLEWIAGRKADDAKYFGPLMLEFFKEKANTLGEK